MDSYYDDTVAIWHYVTGLDGDKNRYRQAIDRLKCKNLDRWDDPGMTGCPDGYHNGGLGPVPTFKITPELTADPIYQAQTAEFYEFIENPNKSKIDYIKHIISQLWLRVIDLTFTPWNVELWVEADHAALGLFCDVHLYDAAKDRSYTRCNKEDGFEIREFPDKYETWGLTNRCAWVNRDEEEDEWNWYGGVHSFDGLSAGKFSDYLHGCLESGCEQPLDYDPSIWPGHNRIVDNGYTDAIEVLVEGFANNLTHMTMEECGLIY